MAAVRRVANSREPKYISLSCTITLRACTRRMTMCVGDSRSKEKGEMDICEIANFLFCGVRVIGANETCLRFLEENKDKYKFKVVKRLDVSGAFHTRQMESAVAKVRDVLTRVEILKPRCNVYSNYTGKIYPAKSADVRSTIAKQIMNPVKWEQIQQLLYRKHRDYTFPMFVELGAGRQLGAMLMQTSKKAYKNYQHFGC